MERKLGTSLNPPVLFYFLLVSLPGTETLEVKVSDSAVKVVKEQDVFIPCTISGYGSTELDLQLLSVYWILRSSPVYIYERGSHIRMRPGSELLNTHLIRGNAGLYIPQVQITDEGKYTCAVTYNNEEAKGRSSLEVSVKPSARLVPSDVIIEEGTERRVMCHANNYYPETIKFQWIKHLNVTQHVVLHQGVSTNEPLENEDGTFSVTSQPSMENDGENYSCIISHRSLGNSLVLDFVLSVKEWRSIMIRAAVGTLAAVILVAGICCGYFMFMKKEPPRLSPITGSELLLHEKKATLSFQISGFRPRPVHITVYLKRKWRKRAEIYSWNSEVQTGSSSPRDTDGWDTTEMEQLLRNGETIVPPAQRQLRVEMVNVIRTNKRGISKCQCTIHITPDLHKDNGAELTVRVTQSALRLPISESCQLDVNEETMLLVMDEDYRVRVGPAPRDPTDNFHERAITLGRLDGLENIALSPTGKLFAIREGKLYSGPVSSCTNQILFSLDRRIGRSGWDMFKFLSFDPRGLLCAVTHSGTVFRGPHPDNENQNWVGDLGVHVGQYNCSDVDSVFFDPQGSLYAKTSYGQIKTLFKPAETDSDWLDLGTKLRQRDGRDSPHVISFCPEGNLWWVSKAEGKLYKGPQPTQQNPGYWGVATFLGQDYNRYKLFGFIGGTFIQRIQKLEFFPELGKIVKEKNIIVNAKTYDNSKGDNTLNDTFSFEKATKERSRFIHYYNIVFVEEAEATFMAGIPVIDMERFSKISLDNNITHQWDFTNTNEREVTLSLQEPVVVESGKAVRMEVSVQIAEISVPYKVRLLTGQGHGVTIEGSWEGITFYNLRATPRED